MQIVCIGVMCTMPAVLRHPVRYSVDACMSENEVRSFVDDAGPRKKGILSYASSRISHEIRTSSLAIADLHTRIHDESERVYSVITDHWNNKIASHSWHLGDRSHKSNDSSANFGTMACPQSAIPRARYWLPFFK